MRSRNATRSPRVWSCCNVVMFTCLNVYLFKCLLVCPALKSALPALVRFGRSCPPPRSSLGVLDFSQAKKNLIKRQGCFHKPSAVFQLAWLPIPELMGLYWIFLWATWLIYQRQI